MQVRGAASSAPSRLQFASPNGKRPYDNLIHVENKRADRLMIVAH